MVDAMVLPYHARRQKRERLRINYRIAAVIAILIVAAVAFFALSNLGVVYLGTQKTVTLNASATLVHMGSVGFTVSLASYNTTAAHIRLARTPIFLNPTLDVTLYPNSTTHVNLGTRYSDLGVKLENIGNNIVTIDLIMINASLSLAPDSSLIKTVNNNVYGGGGSTSIGTFNYTNLTTSVAITQTTSASTTSIAQNATQASIMSAVRKSVYYPIMLNYTVLYANTRNCTPSLYNSTYLLHNGVAPAGADTYTNVSKVVPHSLTFSISKINGDRYDATYTTHSNFTGSNGPAIIIAVNATNSGIINSTVIGAFRGMSVAQIASGYNAAVAIGNACGVYIG
jgi:hypothetical protein